MTLSRWMWRGIFLVLATAWAWLMLLIGLRLITQGPARVPEWSREAVAGGVILVSLGVFIAAVVADRLFPLANRRLSGAVELAAWGLTVVVLIALLLAGAAG